MTNPTIPPCPVCGVVPEYYEEKIYCTCPHDCGKYDTRLKIESACDCEQFSYPEVPMYAHSSVYNWIDTSETLLGRACRELGIETVEQLKAKVQPDPQVAELNSYAAVLLDLAEDAVNGLGYVRDVYGDLYGVGFDRVKIKSEVLPIIRLKMSQLIAAQRGEVEK